MTPDADPAVDRLEDQIAWYDRKSTAAQARAEQGLHEIIRRNEPITFRGLAQTAGVSLDFLYRCTPIRQRVQQLRAQQQNTPPQPAATPTRDETASSVVRTLTAQLTELKRRHRDEIRALTQALEAAHERVIISEPIRNLATSGLPLIGRLGRAGADPGVGSHAQRFTEETLDGLLSGYRERIVAAFKIPGDREKVYVLAAQ